MIFSLVRGERYVFKCGNWIGGRHNDIELPLGKLCDPYLDTDSCTIPALRLNRHAFNV